MRALVVLLSAVLVLWTWRELRAKRVEPPPAMTAARPDGRDGSLAAADLLGLYQGPIQRPDSSEEWLLLEITRVDETANGEVAFAFTLNSAKRAQKGEGRASLRERRIRFQGLSGEIRRRDDGVPVLRSVAIEGPPHWMLERPRAAAPQGAPSR
ncbi:MAG: hypothetical protein ABI779_12695 [Acidobacteriota bacterium]